jgi:LmbE family N-acetylglucosaminyl deacetylase
MREWVRPHPEELALIVVVSPHFDDAALGAAHLLLGHPGSTVVTVFGGPPPAYPEEVTEWDAMGGFRTGDDVVALRREEDRAAMEVLGATPVWLDFADHQYLADDRRATAGEVAAVLEATLDDLAPTAVFVPFGLANPDHDLTHQAARVVMARRPALAWHCYEDAGYCHVPGLLAWRIAGLFRAGLWPTPAIVPVDPDTGRKRAALACYRSQLTGLRADHGLDARLDAPVPEQYWRIAPPPPGWEPLTDVPA